MLDEWIEVRVALTPVDWDWLEVVGLIKATKILSIKGDTSYMFVLKEKFHLDRCTFMLPTWEMTMILEDIYMILKVHMEGEEIAMATNRIVIFPYVGKGYMI